VGRLGPYLPAALGLLVGLLVLGPGLARGFLLRVDMVAVPDPPLKGALLGFASSAPRAVPSDLVLSILGQILPADVAQKLLLLGIFVIGASGVGALTRPFPLPARMTAAFFFVWNPYVAERLLIGHWALLYGYAAMPWIVHAVGGLRGTRDRPTWRRIALALIPAAMGGFSAMLLAAIVLTGACIARRSERIAAMSAIVWLICSLPWLVPSLLHSGALTGDPAGVDAFASRPDTPLGSIGSLLMLGGIWNREAVPGHYADVPLLVLRISLTAAALAGAVLLLMQHEYRLRRGARQALAIPAALGLVIAAVTTTTPGRTALREIVKTWPAAGVLRDAQQFVAPLALLEAVGLGYIVTALLSADRLRAQGAWAYASIVAILPALALPQLAWGIGNTLTPVAYPAAWTQVRKIVDGDERHGALLVVPWSAYRVYSWNPGTVLLDPAVKAFSRRVIADDTLLVGNESVSGEDPVAKRAKVLLADDGGKPTVADCAELGVRFVLVESDDPVPELPGLLRVFAGDGLALYQTPDA
jgi:hypothetical protein